LISSLVALAFRKGGAVIRSGPRVLAPGLEEFSLHYRGVGRRVLVVYSKEAAGRASKLADDATLVVDLVGGVAGGRVAPRDKLDVLLSTVGLNTEVLRVLAGHGFAAVAPRGSPVNSVKEALGDRTFMLLRHTPLLYPYLTANVFYKKVRRWLFTVRTEVHSGRAIVDALAGSYCTYSGERGFECDQHMRRAPLERGDLELLKELADLEDSLCTPETLAKRKGVPLEEAERMLERLEELGFAKAALAPRGASAYRIARIYPPLEGGDPLAGLPLGVPEPDWAFFPFTCVKDFPAKVSGMLSMLEALTGEAPRGATILFYPYLLLWVLRGRRKELVAYDPVTKKVDERVAGVVKDLKIEDCLYLSSITRAE